MPPQHWWTQWSLLDLWPEHWREGARYPRTEDPSVGVIGGFGPSGWDEWGRQWEDIVATMVNITSTIAITSAITIKLNC